MKILAISDIHGEENENLYKYLENNDIDLVIILGDITNFGPLEFVGEFIGKIFDYDCDVIAIPGNCDPTGICKAIGESGAFCLHNEIIGYGDAILFGYGGSNPTPFDTPGEIDDLKIYGDVYELMANYDYVYNSEIPKVKILVTHAPPFNTEADRVAKRDEVIAARPLRSIVKTSLIFTPLYSFNFSISPPLTCLPFLLKQVTLCPSFTILVDNSSTTTSIPPSRDGMCLCPIIAILTVFSPFFPSFYLSTPVPHRSSSTPFTQCTFNFLLPLT